MYNDVTPQTFVGFDDTVVATEPPLDDDAIIAMIQNDDIVEVDDEVPEGDNDDDIEEKKPSKQSVRGALNTLLHYSLFVDSDEIRQDAINLSTKIETDLTLSQKQVTITQFFFKKTLCKVRYYLK